MRLTQRLPLWAQVSTVLGTLFACITMVIAAAGYWDSHPGVQDRVTPYFDWGWQHWWLVPLVILVAIGTAVPAWFRDYARWVPGGLVSWVRWRRLDGKVRSKLEGLSLHAKEILVSTVRVGKPWQGGRLSVESGEVYDFLVSRSRGEWKGYASAWTQRALEELTQAGFLTFVQQGPGIFLVSMSRGDGSRERLADLLDAWLVQKRVWKP